VQHRKDDVAATSISLILRKKKILWTFYFLLWQVKNSKLLKIVSFFTWYFVLGVAKTQDLSSKK